MYCLFEIILTGTCGKKTMSYKNIQQCIISNKIDHHLTFFFPFDYFECVYIRCLKIVHLYNKHFFHAKCSY